MPRIACFIVLAAASLFPSLATAERNTGPWNVEQLKQTPKIWWNNDRSELRGSLYYEGEPYRGKPTRIFAYYALPKKAAHEKVPAMVLVHGGGGTAFKEWADLWADRGYAALAMDLGGCGPNRKKLPDGGPSQATGQKFRLDEGVKNAWPYQAVANVMRGVSLLQSLPEVDPERIGITGISWGGYLTCIVAGVDERLKVAVPVYGCGFLQDNSEWLEIFSRMTPEQRKLWHEQFDPSQYLPGVNIPILFVNGTNDHAYPLDSYQKSYRLVPGERNLCVTVRMPHNHPDGWKPVEIGLFVDSVLRDGKPLAEFTGVTRNGRQVTAQFETTAPIKRAQLHYTTDTGRWQDRHWQSIRAQLDGNRVRAQLPEAERLAWFLTITDQRGATVSTEHEEGGRRKVKAESGKPG